MFYVKSTKFYIMILLRNMMFNELCCFGKILKNKKL